MAKPDMLETAIAYASGLHPGFNGKIQGASSDKIRLLESIVGHGLPKAYVEFLSLMGEKTGTLHFTPECAMDIGSIIELYRDEIVTGQTPVPEGVLVIAAFGLAVPMLYLKPSDADNPGVYAESDDFDLYAESLGNMICHSAFYTHRLPAYGKRVTLHTSGNAKSILESATRIILKAGFSALPFSDKAHHRFLSDTAGVAVQDIASSGRMITIGFRDEAEAQRLIEELQQEFHFKTMRH